MGSIFFFLLGLNETKPSAGPHTVCFGDSSIFFLEQPHPFLGPTAREEVGANGSLSDSEFWRTTAMFMEGTSSAPTAWLFDSVTAYGP